MADIYNCETIFYEKEVLLEEYMEDCVDVPRFLSYCRQCSNFGKVWSCPDFDFNPIDYWNRYEHLRIIAMKIIVPEELREKKYDEQGKTEVITTLLDGHKRDFDQYVYEQEKTREGSVGLSGGSCLLCRPGPCSREEGKPCRQPDRMRHSIEALGGDVSLTVTKYLGQKLEWIEDGRLPAHFMIVGGLLW